MSAVANNSSFRFIEIPGITKPCLEWHGKIVKAFDESPKGLCDLMKKIGTVAMGILIYPALGVLAFVSLFARTKPIHPAPQAEISKDTVGTTEIKTDTAAKPVIAPTKPDQSETVDEYIAFAKTFIQDRKDKKIDIYTTHIPFFATWVVKNFEAFYPKNVVGDETVENFRAEMESRIKDGKVTYEWWLVFNMRLSILMTPKEFRSTWAGDSQMKEFDNTLFEEGWKDHDRSKSSLKTYLENPEYVFFPSYLGDFTIEGINRTFYSGAFLVGLINKPIMVDGRLMYPDQFFKHDLVHYQNERYQHKDPEIMLTAKKSFYEKRAAESNPHIIQLLDFTFFYATHEVILGTTAVTECMQNRPDFLIDLFEKGEFFRADWYKDHIPKPESLNCRSINEMTELGARIFTNWVGTSPVPIQVSSRPDSTEYKIRIPRNLFSYEQQFIILNQSQLDLYNRLVVAINDGENLAPLMKELKDAGNALNRVILLQGIYSLFEEVPV